MAKKRDTNTPVYSKKRSGRGETWIIRKSDGQFATVNDESEVCRIYGQGSEALLRRAEAPCQAVNGITA